MESEHTHTPGLTRRTMITGAAWATPAIALMAASPAHAASGDTRTMSVWSPEERTTAGGDPGTVIASVTDAKGTPLAGQPVTFAGPDDATLAGSGETRTASNAGAAAAAARANVITVTTNADGLARISVSFDDAWAMPGARAITATTSFASETTTITVLGANAYAVGYNYYSAWAGTVGALGTDSTDEVLYAPVQLSRVFPSPIENFVGNTFTIALLADGSVWSVGFNNAGQLCDGGTVDRNTWAQIASLPPVKKVAASQTVYALLEDGTVRAWGNNRSGALGNGSTRTHSTRPVRVLGISGAHDVAAMEATGLAVLRNGAVLAWGDNSAGQYGNGSTASSVRPATVSLPGPVDKLAVGPSNAFAVLTDGRVYAWGKTYGSTPVPFTTFSSDDPVVQFVSVASNTYALLRSGTVKAWGRNSSGELGDDGSSSSATPVTVMGTGVDNPASQITACSGCGFAELTQGAFSWGDNSRGALGSGDPGLRLRRTPGGVEGLSGRVRLGPPTLAQSMFFFRD